VFFRTFATFASILLVTFSLSAAIDIECNYRTKTLATYKNIYCCVPKKIEINSQVNITGIIGIHEKDKSDSDVEAIHWDKSGNWNFLPSVFGKHFKNFKVLMVNKANLKEIRKSDLQNFHALEFLSLQKNDLEIIEENLFEANPNLQVIYLNNNKIKQVAFNVLSHLKKLSYVDFSENICISKTAFASKIEGFKIELNNNCGNVTAAISKGIKPVQEKSIEAELNNTKLAAKISGLETKVEDKMTKLRKTVNELADNSSNLAYKIITFVNSFALLGCIVAFFLIFWKKE
jgi:hypothetical protein